MRSARPTDETFEPRGGFEPRALRDARTARILFLPAVARWEVEKGAVPLEDGSALAERPFGSEEWLVGEVLSYRGQAIVVEPASLRERVAAGARALQDVLGAPALR